jgi:hypothetical protein
MPPAQAQTRDSASEKQQSVATNCCPPGLRRLRGEGRDSDPERTTRAGQISASQGRSACSDFPPHQCSPRLPPAWDCIDRRTSQSRRPPQVQGLREPVHGGQRLTDAPERLDVRQAFRTTMRTGPSRPSARRCLCACRALSRSRGLHGWASPQARAMPSCTSRSVAAQSRACARPFSVHACTPHFGGAGRAISRLSGVLHELASLRAGAMLGCMSRSETAQFRASASARLHCTPTPSTWQAASSALGEGGARAWEEASVDLRLGGWIASIDLAVHYSFGHKTAT